MTRFRLLVAYNGQGYYGWQKQNSLPTIQGAIEKTLGDIFQKPVVVVGAGRTDAGVHAFGQVAHFDIEGTWPPRLCLQKALNSLLPSNICVKGVWKAPLDFHALHSSVRKSYVYYIDNQAFPNVFRQGQMHWYPYPVDLALLQQMSRIIPGEHDFKSFQSAGTPVKTTVRRVLAARWISGPHHLLLFHIQAKGFLKQMIRNLVGTQLALMKKYSSPQNTPSGKKAAQALHHIFLAKARQSALGTAPPEGLYLHRVFYSPELDKKCQKL